MPQRFVADIVVGILAILVNLCCAGIAGIFVFAAGIVTQMGPSSRDSAFVPEYSSEVAIMGVVMLLGSLMLLAAGIGIIVGKKWGFVLAIVGASVLVIGWILGEVLIPSQRDSQADAAIDLAGNIVYFSSCLTFGIYSALRLGGTIGPRPN